MVMFQGCYSYSCVSGLLQLQLCFRVTTVTVVFQDCYSYDCVSGLLQLQLCFRIATVMLVPMYKPTARHDSQRNRVVRLNSLSCMHGTRTWVL